MINNNYDTLISEQEIWPLRPFLSEVLDEGQTLKVGVLPGTVIFPDIKESYDPLNSDDIVYFNLKEDEGIYLYLEASYNLNPIYGKMNTRDPNIAIACILKPAQKQAIKAVDKEIQRFLREIAALEIRIKELQDELSSIIAEIDKDIQNQQTLTTEGINQITNNPNLTQEQKAIQIGILQDSLKSYIERAEEKKAFLDEEYSTDIERIRCFTGPTTTPAPTTQAPTTPTPTLVENLPLDFQVRYLTCSDFYDKNVSYPDYPPPLSGFSGICRLNQEIIRLQKIKEIISARYSIAEGEERKNSSKYYVHNTLTISIKLSIVKMKNPETEERQGSVKIYFPLALALKYQTAETATPSPTLLQNLTTATTTTAPPLDGLYLSSNAFKFPQLILSYFISNEPTITHVSLEALQCIYNGFTQEYTKIGFNLSSF